MASLTRTLIDGALVVCDAGYQGYPLAASLSDAGAFFLMRVSSQTIFYTEDTTLQAQPISFKARTVMELTAETLGKWTDGLVYYWPEQAQRENKKPIEVRLLCVKGKTSRKDVWLVSNVLGEGRLSLATAGKFYKMRWENEGYFRTYKQTLKKVKLAGRTVRAVHREALGAMLAVQVLLAQGAAGAILLGNKKAANSARRLLLLVRKEMEAAQRGKVKLGFLGRAGACNREQRQRSSNKQKREWPSRQAAKPLNPPRIRQLSDAAKLLLRQHLANVA